MDENTIAHWHDINFDYRQEMLSLGRERLVVSAVIVWDSKVLLVRRSQHDSNPGMWEFPGGGVDDGEQVVDAIRREVKEETSIEIPMVPRGEVLTHPTRTALRIVMRFDIEGEPKIILSEEHDSYMFIDIATVNGQNKDNIEIYNSMRAENQLAAKLVLGNGTHSA